MKERGEHFLLLSSQPPTSLPPFFYPPNKHNLSSIKLLATIVFHHKTLPPLVLLCPLVSSPLQTLLLPFWHYNPPPPLSLCGTHQLEPASI
uniref:Uncharacterized protein n=1 Tax=Meloidogyne enterolobii TaxID=390850 RepID=A0A6V7UJN2_MELEN|nr:unnamed protein product [Meloidogyne enterolobii]